MNFSASADALRTTLTRHDITAHDVANINTKGYRQKIPYQSEQIPSGVKISHVKSSPNAPTAISNTELTQEVTEMITNKNVSAANVNVIKVQNQMTGELLDLVG